MSESNCVTHFACDCITRKIIKYDQLEKENAELKSLFSVQLDMLEQNKKMSAEIEKLQQKLDEARNKVEESQSLMLSYKKELDDEKERRVESARSAAALIRAEKSKSQSLVDAFRFVEKAETKGSASVAFYPPLIEKAKAVLAEYKGEG